MLPEIGEVEARSLILLASASITDTETMALRTALKPSMITALRMSLTLDLSLQVTD
jgi:hypothetical protein